VAGSCPNSTQTPSTALIGVQMGELFPKLTVSGDLGIEGPKFSDITGGGARAYNFGPSISWRPFDSGRIRSRVKAADARAEEAL
jgi:multidrug efflux system outer membrane protein